MAFSPLQLAGYRGPGGAGAVPCSFIRLLIHSRVMNMVRKYRLYGVFFALFAAFILFAGPARAQTLNLAHTAVARDGDVLTARFGITLGGAEEIAESLRNGIPLQLIGTASLYRARRLWVNQLLGSGEYMNQLSYDSLKKEYVVQPSGKGQELRGPELEPLLEKLWAEIVMPLGKWKLLQRGDSYSLKVHVALDRTQVPGWVSRALFFWDWEDGASTSYQLDFRF